MDFHFLMVCIDMFAILMAAKINGSITVMLLEDHHVYKTIRNAWVGEVFVCEQETQIKVVVSLQGWHL